MIKRDIKVKPNEVDSACTMFLSLYSGFCLSVYKNYDEDYVLSLHVMSNKNTEVAYDDYYTYVIGDTISLNNVSNITKSTIKDIKDTLLGKKSENLEINVINYVISNNIEKIKEELRELLLGITKGCNFCLGYNELDADENSNSSINIWMENNKLYAQDYYEGVYSINYCPMCGRKLKEN